MDDFHIATEPVSRICLPALFRTLNLTFGLLLIFFSTTFSPGAGVPGLKALRYLFARFYLWCRVPGVLNQVTHACGVPF